MDLELSKSKGWLADFVESGVDQWFQKLEGKPCPNYSFRKLGHTLKILQKAKLVETLWLVKIPASSSRESLGEVSDGQHIIEAVFTKDATADLLQAGAQIGSLLRLFDPEVRVRANVEPPRPQLVVDRWVMVDKDSKPQPFSFGFRLTEDKNIQQKMGRYHAVKSHKRTASSSNPTPHDSPREGSFASQNPYSPRGTGRAFAGNEDEDGDISKEQFCTQVPAPMTLLGPKKSAPSLALRKPDLNPPVDNNQLLQPFFGEGALRICTDSSSPPSEPAHVLPKKSVSAFQKAAGLTESKISSAPQLSVNPLLVGKESTFVQDDPEKSSPIEVNELEAHLQPSAPKFAEAKDGESLIAIAASNPRRRVAPVRHPNVPIGPFQRWRQQTHGGCHIPRYVSKIPQDQEEFLKSLLDTGDSWQPPLVGHVPRPGEVPFALLEQLCHAADKQAENLTASLSPAGPFANTSQSPHNIHNDRTKAPTEADSEDEDAGQGEVEWSQSPPTQQRRQHQLVSVHPAHDTASESEESADLSSSPPAPGRQMPGLPKSSPPVELSRQKHFFDPKSSPEIGDAVAEKSASKSQGPAEEGEVHEVASPRRGRGYRPPSHISEGHVESTPSIAETSPSAHSSRVSVENKENHNAQKPLASSQALRDTSATKVQVNRTPYPGKATNLLQRMREQQTDTDPISSLVPATYGSPTSYEVAVVAGTKHAEAPAALENSSLRKATTGRSDPAEASDLPQAGTSKDVQREVDPTPIRRETSKVVASALAEVPSSTDNHGPSVVSSTGEARGLGSQLYVSRREHPKCGNNIGQDESTTRPTNDRSIPQQLGSTSTPMEDIEIVVARPISSLAAPALTKRKRKVSEDTTSQTKRQQQHTQTADIDPDYVPIYEKRRTDRRHQMQAISKPKAPLRQSTSSSVMDMASSIGIAEPAPNIAKQSQLPRTTMDVSLQSSTPLTRHSTYSGIWTVQDKAQHGDSASVNSPIAVTTESDEDLFANYQAAYPDYKGSMNDFRKSYYFIQGVLNEEPNKIHSSLLDDAVYHHFHSYLPSGQATGFVKYFNDCIDDPSHHKRVIKFSAPMKIPSREPSRRSTGNSSLARQVHPSIDARSVLSDSANPTPSAKDELEEKRRRFLERTTSETPIRAILSQESIESIERWREDAAQRGSPELGTSDIDRSLLQTSRRQTSVAITNNPTSTVKRQSLPSARPTPQPTLKPTGPSIRDRSPAITAQIQRRPEPSSTSFVKPRRPSLTKRVEESIPLPNTVVAASLSAPPRKMAIGTNRVFTDFGKKYAQTLVRKREEAAVARTAFVAGDDKDRGRPTGMGINIFSWEK